MTSGNTHTAHSPTPSHTSSAFSALAVQSSSSFEVLYESDGDEVVWAGNELDSDDEFILVPHLRPAPPIPDATDTPVFSLSQLSLEPEPPRTTPTTPTRNPKSSKVAPKPRSTRSGQKASVRPTRSVPAEARKVPRGRRRRGKRDSAASYPSPSPSPVRDATRNPISEEDGSGFGKQILIEECDYDEPGIKGYEEAVRYITSFLSRPKGELPASAPTRLKFLQSLIIELGLLAPTSVLPSSLSAAKRLLKTNAFVNINMYLSVREKGLDQLHSIMFRSRKELANDLRRKRGPKANRVWVKQHGLSVLLVPVF